MPTFLLFPDDGWYGDEWILRCLSVTYPDDRVGEYIGTFYTWEDAYDNAWALWSYPIWGRTA